MAQPRRQSGEVYRVANTQDLASAMAELNVQLQRITARLNQLEGHNGTPTFYDAVNLNGKRLMHVATPVDEEDAVPAGQALRKSTAGTAFDARSLRIVNLPDGAETSDAVNLSQLRAMERHMAPTDAAYVVAVASTPLTADRLLSGEGSVITITDNGANSTIVVSITANGVGNTKLRQGAATSVIGRSANSVGNVADIAAAADNEILRRSGGTLAFGTVSTAMMSDVVAGTYTPTLTNVANLDASTAYEAQYLRVGATVVVSGRVDVDPTAGAASTQLGISLPVASNLGATEDCAGTAFASGIAGQGAAILGDAANNRAQMQWVSGDVTNQAMYFTFAYQVI